MIAFLKSRSKPEPRSQPTLAQRILPSISISPQQPNLVYVKNEQVSIRPKKIYHPTKKWKTEIGDPLEANVVYLPIGGLRKCLICGNLT